MNFPASTALQPTAYHVALRAFLQQHEPGAWDWLASAQSRADYAESLRLELLKSTYRLDRASHGAVYDLAATALARLGLEVPLTLYQAQQSSQLNAGLYYLPGQAHIVFSGPVLTLLSAPELAAVLGHELAHYHLWQDQDGAFLVLDRMVQALATNPRAEPCHLQTARRLQLYTEIYADRGSLVVGGDLPTAVAALVKMSTGLANVSGQAYLEQAREIFARQEITTEGLDHPEAFIRTHALALVADNAATATAAEDRIEQLISGPLRLGSLDLLGQQQLTSLTRQLLQQLLQPAWFRSEPVLGQARLYFDDFTVPAAAPAPAMTALGVMLAQADQQMRDYVCYVLLDFAAVDPGLEQAPLAAALVLADQFQLGDRLEQLAAKELDLTKKEAARLRRDAARVLAQAT